MRSDLGRLRAETWGYKPQGRLPVTLPKVSTFSQTALPAGDQAFKDMSWGGVEGISQSNHNDSKGLCFYLATRLVLNFGAQVIVPPELWSGWNYRS